MSILFWLRKWSSVNYVLSVSASTASARSRSTSPYFAKSYHQSPNAKPRAHSLTRRIYMQRNFSYAENRDRRDGSLLHPSSLSSARRLSSPLISVADPGTYHVVTTPLHRDHSSRGRVILSSISPRSSSSYDEISLCVTTHLRNVRPVQS